MQRPRVSFCFTTYKRFEYLRKTLESVQKQTFPDFEVIVSDNDPEQSARTIVESFDERFKYFPNHENLGMKKSFNKSLERSSGEYIVMIADDDPVYPDMLETLIGLAENYPGYGMYMGGCDWFCTEPQIGKLYNFNVGTNSCLSNNFSIGHIQTFSAEEFVIKLFSLKIFSHYLWSTCIVQKNILLEIEGVPDYGTPFLGDYAYLSAVGAKKGVVVINKSLGCQTLHNENFGRNQNEQLILAAKNFPTYVKDKTKHLQNWPLIEQQIYRFTALWIVSHLSFLHHYYQQTGNRNESFRQAEKELFKLKYLTKYKFKYLLKKNFPVIHNLAVKIKSFIK
ncbi:MAG: hypothetical protein C4308_11920 [Chitinophagaceae bacterium]|mgnify:CR=1 FL=1